jgi:hypothetical protein
LRCAVQKALSSRPRALELSPQRHNGDIGTQSAGLSSDAKCNTPRRFDIGKVVSRP